MSKFEESDIDQLVAEHQATLLYNTERYFTRRPLSKPVRQAFLDTPRHRFAPRFYSFKRGGWVEPNADNLKEHLSELYADHPIGIYRDRNGRTLSTVSQPSLVLYMLELLELKAGMRVFELGGGSGWNAAMIGRIVGPAGRVVSVEIIEPLAKTAKSIIAQMGLEHVDMIAGDGSAGVAERAPYQRGVFTASAWDLPTPFFEQIETGGLLLFVVKIQPGTDLLALLRKTDRDAFASDHHFPCSFVSVTGSHATPERDSIRVDTLPQADQREPLDWSDIRISNTEASDFCDFARVVFDCQQAYLLEEHGADIAEEFAGIASPAGDSLVLFNEDRVIQVGGDAALIALRRAAKRWSKAKRPGIEDLDLSIHRADTAPEPSNDQWLVPRGQSCLLWSIRS